MSTSQAHGRRKPQIEKQDLYMLTALWMEQSPWAMKETEKERVVGAVFVTPNDRVLSVDCSRDNNGGVVHGAIRALLKYPDQVQGCYVYLSRQPCAHCVKMLVQAAVKKVFYLPLRPERLKEKEVKKNEVEANEVKESEIEANEVKESEVEANKVKESEVEANKVKESEVEANKVKESEVEENKSVDALFKVSPVSREVYVPNITDGDTEELKSANEKNLYGIPRKLGTDEMVATKVEWDEEWKNEIVGKIGWHEYSDDEIQKQVDEDMKKFFQWFDKGIVATGEKEMTFKKRGKDDSQGTGPTEAKKQLLDQDPASVDQGVARHLSRLAQMLSNRTDDPNRGVGCVIVVKDEIVAIGWNGFPSKALYGNHPRGKSKEQGKPDKYPHVIHAEQNALMRRNRRNIDGATAYVNKIPCNECVPMLCNAGIEKIFLSKGAFKDEKDPPKSEKNFYDLLQNPDSSLTVYQQK